MMENKQTGFTLIELVVVIVILGILAATALPKFVSLSTEAGDAAAKGVAGALTSATAMNYAKYLVNSAGATAVNTGMSCGALSAMMANGSLSSDGKVSFVSAGASLSCGTAGNYANNCSVSHSNGTSAGVAVSVICTG